VIFCTFRICFEHVTSQRGTAQANLQQKNLRKTAKLCLVTERLLFCSAPDLAPEHGPDLKQEGLELLQVMMREEIITPCQQDTHGAVNLNHIRDPPVPEHCKGPLAQEKRGLGKHD